MKIQNGYLDLIKAAISDFKRSKIRTFLTSLGIMIGVFAVIMLTALGLGLKKYISGITKSNTRALPKREARSNIFTAKFHLCRLKKGKNRSDMKK